MIRFKKPSILKCLLCFLVISFIIISCSEEDNLDPEGQWELIAPTPQLPSANDRIVLDQTTPNQTITFNWEAAVSTANFGITYEVSIHELTDTEFTSPLITVSSAENGNGLSTTLRFRQIDELLSFQGYPANEDATVVWLVKATSLSKTSSASNTLVIKRFEDELLPDKLYISGSATEDNNVLSQARRLKRLSNADGSLSRVFEIYTNLIAGQSYQFYSENALPSLQYGGESGSLIKDGNAIVADENGVYRIRVDALNNTYELLRIDFLSLVGEPIEGGWGSGDTPLQYQNNGVWKANIEFINSGSFAFRFNGDWNYLLKEKIGTPNTLILENDAASQGAIVQDLQASSPGIFEVTVTLNFDDYSYSIDQDMETPNTLFLLENGVSIKEFNKNGNLFELNEFIPMQATASYLLSTTSNGSGITYALTSSLAESDNPNDDRVEGNSNLIQSDLTFTTVSDRAIKLQIDFATATVNWTYYNFKLFHWNVWENRDEFQMTYEHPNRYRVISNLLANYEMKFITPWDFQFGSTTPSELNGDLVEDGSSSSNIVNITSSGNYEIIIELDPSYESGSYEFVSL